MTTAFRELDSVVLVHDIPEAGLRAGDLGAIVMVYAPDAFEVEFATALGYAQALVTLDASDVRAVRDDDLLTVRPATPSGNSSLSAGLVNRSETNSRDAPS
jgi:hypothetical protein